MNVTVKTGKKNARPFNKRMLVIQDEAEKVTKSGLFIPDSVQEKPTTGTVLEVAKEIEGISPGDSIMFSKFAGLPIRLDNVDYLLIHQGEVIMVLEEGDDLTKQ